MTATERLTDEVTGIELEEVLAPAEPDGVYRDSRECAALALQGGTTTLLLSPPTPRPKKG
ncbi:hypothetical protein ACIQ6Y_20080 [Streptomyces sp. NPDC096205]|uniref:hypothetical protein n=1 Tax=Streptomyces sp. NPDC096205 TaxID=3366081 RepID=UPI003816BBB9